MTLSNDQIRVKVAELLGWTNITHMGNQPDNCRKYYLGTPSGLNPRKEIQCKDSRMEDIPKYTTSFDSCVEFETILTQSQRGLYVRRLLDQRKDQRDLSKSSDYFLVFATPLQRCLAFIQTITEGK